MKIFTKKAMTVAVLTGLCVPGFASAEAEIFGKAHLSFGSVSEDEGTKTTSNTVTSHASRVGVKGDVATESGLKVIYRFVWEVDMADTSKDSTSVDFVGAESKSSNHIKSREQYVGLAGSWGEFRIGRDDSPYKLAGKKNVEHLSDTWADFNNIIDKGQDTRNDDSIAYYKEIGPGKLGIMYAAGDDKPSAENAGASSSIAYDLKAAGFGFALAQQTIEKSATNDETGLKLSLGYKFADTQLGLMLEKVEDDENLDDKNTYFSVKQAIGKNDSIIVSYGLKDQGLTDDATMAALAYQHKLDKKIALYALLANGTDGGLHDASKLAGDGSALVGGVIAKF